MASVSSEQIASLPTMTQALQLCQTLSGLESRDFIGPRGIVKDAAQWSRIMAAGQHNFPQDQLNKFMDMAGNEAPMLWLLNSRGYDITALRKLETETERALRLEREQSAKLRERLAYAESILQGRGTVTP